MKRRCLRRELSGPIEKELGAEVVQRWLKPFKVLRFDAGNLYLEAKDYFQALWFEEHIRPKAHSKLVNNNNRKIKIHLTVASANQHEIQNQKPRKGIKDPKNTSPPSFQLSFDSLDNFCTFEHYTLSEGNHVPYQIACELAGYDPKTQQVVQKELGYAVC